MRVAVLVHNDVVRDARVRKEVRTLVDAGHDVDVYGLIKSGTMEQYPSSVEGSKGLYLSETRIPRSSNIKKAFFNLKKAVELALLGCFIAVMILGNTELLVQGVAVFLPLVMLFANELKARKRKAPTSTGSLLQSYIPVIAAIVLCLIARVLFEYGVTSWLVSSASITAVAAVWYLGLMVTDVKRAVGRLKSKITMRSQAKAREVRFHQLAGLLKAAVGDKEYDIVHCHDVIALIAGGALKQSNPTIKLFWDAHEIYEDLAQGDAALGDVNRRIIQENQKFVDGFVTISESFADFYKTNYNLPPAHVVMNATRYVGEAVDDGTLRAAAGLGADRKILLYQGGFARLRGIEKLAEAAKSIPEPWSIVMMGWGELEEYLQTCAVSLIPTRDGGAAAARLVVMPPASQEDLAKWTAGADLGVIPYENKGLNHLYCTPNKLWEFPNAGVPILATDLVEIGRMLRTWNTGFLLPREFSSDDIVRFLEKLNADDLEACRINARKFSKEMAWSYFEPQLLKLYGGGAAA